MSFFNEMLSAGLGLIREAAGEPVKYFDGSFMVSITNAVPRRIVPVADQQFDAHTLAYGRIWDVERKQLAINGRQFEPTRGHIIMAMECNTEVAWEVVDNPITERCWEYVDTGATEFKIFTIRKAL